MWKVRVLHKEPNRSGGPGGALSGVSSVYSRSGVGCFFGKLAVKGWIVHSRLSGWSPGVGERLLVLATRRPIINAVVRSHSKLRQGPWNSLQRREAWRHIPCRNPRSRTQSLG